MKRSILKFAVIALAVSLTSCDEELGIDGEAGVEQKLSEQFLKAESIGIDVYNIVDVVRRDSAYSPNDSIIFDGANVWTYDNGSGATIISVNYGTGVIGADGKTRKGSILALETGDYTQSGGALAVSFTNYEVDNVKITGSGDMKNSGSDQFELKFTDLKIDEEFKLNANQDLNWVAGLATGDAADDKYELSGTITGTQLEDANSIDITIAATDALSYDRSCEFGMVSGIANLALTGDSISFDSGSIDFLASDGCNNNVDLTLKSADGKVINVIEQFQGF